MLPAVSSYSCDNSPVTYFAEVYGVSVIFSLKLRPSQPVVVQLCQHTHLPGNLIPYLAANKLYDVAVGRRPVNAR